MRVSPVRSFLLCGAALVVAGCATTRAPYVLTAADYRLYAAPDMTSASLGAIVARARAADVVIFGEEHDDRVGHALELAILDSLHAAFGDSLALSMEMFSRDVQPVMDEYLDSLVREKDLMHDARPWSNYADYRPLVEFARAHHLPVIAANAPERYVNLAGRRGERVLERLAPAGRGWIAPLPYDTASGAYYRKLMGEPIHDTAARTPAAADTAHRDSVRVKPPPGMPASFNMNVSQSLWDATMAWSIAAFHRAHPGMKIYEVNGRFHSDERFAVVAQLARYAPQARVVVISAGRDERFPAPALDSLKTNGDFILVTNPGVPPSFVPR